MATLANLIKMSIFVTFNRELLKKSDVKEILRPDTFLPSETVKLLLLY